MDPRMMNEWLKAQAQKQQPSTRSIEQQRQGMAITEQLNAQEEKYAKSHKSMLNSMIKQYGPDKGTRVFYAKVREDVKKLNEGALGAGALMGGQAGYMAGQAAAKATAKAAMNYDALPEQPMDKAVRDYAPLNQYQQPRPTIKKEIEPKEQPMDKAVRDYAPLNQYQQPRPTIKKEIEPKEQPKVKPSSPLSPSIGYLGSIGGQAAGYMAGQAAADKQGKSVNF